MSYIGSSIFNESDSYVSELNNDLNEGFYDVFNKSIDEFTYVNYNLKNPAFLCDSKRKK